MYFGCDDEGEENEDFECDDMDDTKAYVYDFFPLDVGRMEDITICPEDREGENIYRKYSGISSEANKLSTKKTKLKASNIYLTDVMDMFGESVSIMPAGRTFFFATITEELKEEGYVREILSKVQNMRKESGFEVLDRINLYVSENEMLEKVIKKYSEQIQKDTLADNIIYNEKGKEYTETSINGEKLNIAVEKIMYI